MNLWYSVIVFVFFSSNLVANGIPFLEGLLGSGDDSTSKAKPSGRNTEGSTGLLDGLLKTLQDKKGPLVGSVGESVSKVAKPALGRAVQIGSSISAEHLKPEDYLPYENDKFCYGEKSCETWSGMCQSGGRQSPINVVRPSDPSLALDEPVLVMEDGWESMYPVYVANTGHSVLVRLSETGLTDITIELMDINHRYNFSHIVFHWGSNNIQGSEHLLNGKAYAMEIQFVHYNLEYNSLEEALRDGDHEAVAIISVFAIPGRNNRHYDGVIEEILKSATSKTFGFVKTDITVNPDDLMPINKSLYRLRGSLTLPPCLEKVAWVILEKPIRLSDEQLNSFRKIQCSHGKPLADNFRGPQPINQRQVYFSSS